MDSAHHSLEDAALLRLSNTIRAQVLFYMNRESYQIPEEVEMEEEPDRHIVPEAEVPENHEELDADPAYDADDENEGDFEEPDEPDFEEEDLWSTDEENWESDKENYEYVY